MHTRKTLAGRLHQLHCLMCFDVVRNVPKANPCRCRCHRVTAETITDDQIRELCNSCEISFDRLYRAVHRERPVGESQAAYDRQRLYHRGLAAAAWNARHGDEPIE
jgi:hypothetical protein